MRRMIAVALMLTLGSASNAAAQAADTPYQIRHLTNLEKKDAMVELSNGGASRTALGNGNLCVNAYAFNSSGAIVDCCSCYVPPNSMRRLSAQADLLVSVAKPWPEALTVKLIATLAGPSGAGTSADCNAAVAGDGMHPLATGMVAWATTSLPKVPKVGNGVEQTSFTPATLSAYELYTGLNAACLAIHPTANLCPSCP